MRGTVGTGPGTRQDQKVTKMVDFVGIECAREALATEIHRQLKEDKSMCPACYFAHRTLARSILRTTKTAQIIHEIKKDMKDFDEYRKKALGRCGKARKAMKPITEENGELTEDEKRSVGRGIEDIRAGRVMTKTEFLKKHPELR